MCGGQRRHLINNVTVIFDVSYWRNVLGVTFSFLFALSLSMLKNTDREHLKFIFRHEKYSPWENSRSFEPHLIKLMKTHVNFQCLFIFTFIISYRS
jgi:hypothetical protein